MLFFSGEGKLSVLAKALFFQKPPDFNQLQVDVQLYHRVSLVAFL